ncbi:MAG: tyrosine-protein phosphatase [Acidimicrobiales bacterium]
MTVAPPLVDVDRSEEGDLTISWRWEGGAPPGSVTVEVAAGDPDAPAFAGLEVTAGQTRVRFAQVPEHPRVWVRMRFGEGPHLLVAERRVPVAGTLNFRDLGGYPVSGGGRTAWGRVFRSDNFATVEPAAWRRLHEMGLREIFDLRHDAERERQPTSIPDDLDLAVSVLAIGGEAAEAPDVIGLLTSSGGEGFGLDYMVTMYHELLDVHRGVFVELLTHLSDPERLPAVFHCTAGKDRTGVAAALLLSLVGVDRETVLDDYELTTRYRSGRRIEAMRPQLEAAGVDVEAVRPFLSAPRPALAAALAAVDDQHGSVEAFLIGAGLAPTAIDRLRASLIDRG